MLVAVKKPDLIGAGQVHKFQWGSFVEATKDIPLESKDSLKLSESVWLLDPEKDASAFGHIVFALGALPFDKTVRLLWAEGHG